MVYSKTRNPSFLEPELNITFRDTFVWEPWINSFWYQRRMTAWWLQVVSIPLDSHFSPGSPSKPSHTKQKTDRTAITYQTLVFEWVRIPFYWIHPNFRGWFFRYTQPLPVALSSSTGNAEEWPPARSRSRWPVRHLSRFHPKIMDSDHQTKGYIGDL